MSSIQRRLTLVSCVAFVAVAAGLIPAVKSVGTRSAAPSQAPSPRTWHLLQTDPPGGCGMADGSRDATAAYWSAEGGYLHMRLCMSAAPGWQQEPGGGWSDARYKWWIGTPAARYMLLVEDYPDQSPSSPASDGMGEATLIDDRNGNGTFGDDWARRSPPEYIDNALGSPIWRRAWSGIAGPRQASTMGDVGDVGFRLSTSACGPVIDVYVRLDIVGDPADVCLSWATDTEGPALDSRPACDSGPGTTCVSLSPPNVDTPTAIVPPTNTAFVPPSPSSTAPVAPSSTSTASPTLPPKPTATPTLTVPPSATTTVAPSATATTEPSRTVTAESSRTATVAPSSPPTAQPTATTAAPPSITATDTAQPTRAPTDTMVPPPSATATRTMAPPPSLTPTAGQIVASPTPTATRTPGAIAPTQTGTPPGGTTTTPSAPTPGPTQSPSLGCLTICLRDVTSGQSVPFPDQATVHAVLLTPWGAPAKPAAVQPVGSGACGTFANVDAGQYRVWATVGQGWQLAPGTTSPQALSVGNQPPCSQAVFRYVQAGGMPPFPPGPPTGIPTPPGAPTTIPQPTAYPPSPDRPAVGASAQLPILGYLGSDPVCTAWVEAQNIGDRPAKALLLLWGDPGFCPPQCAGPLKVECSGLLAPGTAWNFLGAQMPQGARSGLVVSASVSDLGGDIFADALCETLFHDVVGDCDDYRRFRKAYEERGRFGSFDFGAETSQPFAVEVLRSCPGDVRPAVRVTSSYEGVAGEFLGRWDPVYGGYAYFAPSVYAGTGGFTSMLYVQNAGLECTSVELWFKPQDNCLRPRICDILTLAPGETIHFDASSCLPLGFVGGAWVRSSQPLAIAIDQIGNDVLMTYTGQPGALNYVHDGEPLFTTGSSVAYAPLVYSEYQGWDTAIVVQNLSSTSAAKVKVYFLDRSGGVIATVADWVCPQGVQTFFLPAIGGLPGHWVGAARVESQDWFTPGGPSVSGPYIQAVAQLVQYADIARSEAQEAVAYNLFPERLAFDWQLGSGAGGTASGVGRIGIPSFLKDWHNSGVTSEIAIANVVSKPGITNFALFIYDQNGLIDYVCESLSNGQVEYIDLAGWGFINPGFRGSAVISATFWEHEVFDSAGGFVRNLVGLAAAKIERSGTTLGSPIPGDESAASPGFPIPGPFRFNGPSAPRCPGQPGGLPPGPAPTATPGGGPGGTPPMPPGPPTGPPPTP